MTDHDALCMCIECLPTAKLSPAEQEAIRRAHNEWGGGSTTGNDDFDSLVERHLIDVMAETSRARK